MSEDRSRQRTIRGELRALASGLRDGSLVLALVVGLATIPVTIVLSLGTLGTGSTTVGGEGLFVAGLFVGAVYSQRAASVSRAGMAAGLGGAPAVLALQFYAMAGNMAEVPTAGAAILAALTPLVLVVGIGLAMLVAVLGAVPSGWFAQRLRERGRSQRN